MIEQQRNQWLTDFHHRWLASLLDDHKCKLGTDGMQVRPHVTPDGRRLFVLACWHSWSVILPFDQAVVFLATVAARATVPSYRMGKRFGRSFGAPVP